MKRILLVKLLNLDSNGGLIGGCGDGDWDWDEAGSI